MKLFAARTTRMVPYLPVWYCTLPGMYALFEIRVASESFLLAVDS